MTTEESYGWEITIEPDQKCCKSRLKTRDGHLPTIEDIDKIIDKFEYIGKKLIERGFTVAPL